MIDANPLSMCDLCVASERKQSIVAQLPSQLQLHSCSQCERYLLPPKKWVAADWESRERLACPSTACHLPCR